MEELIDSPVPVSDGLILNVYGVIPPEAVTGIKLSADPTVMDLDAIATVVLNTETPVDMTLKVKDVDPVKPDASVNVTVYDCDAEITLGVPVKLTLTELYKACALVIGLVTVITEAVVVNERPVGLSLIHI